MSWPHFVTEFPQLPCEVGRAEKIMLYLQKTGSSLLGGLLRVTRPAWQEKVGWESLLPGASSSLLLTLTQFNRVQTEEKLTPHSKARTGAAAERP